MKMNITASDVEDFKTRYCDENPIIADLIRTHCSKHLHETVLDVGAGLGDIAGSAFPDKRAILLDPLDYSDAPRSRLHRRHQGDFFDFSPNGTTVGTLIFCHSLQFLDASHLRLFQKLDELAPKTVLVVINKNNGVFGDLLAFITKKGHRLNPEISIPGFPSTSYGDVAEYPFTAILQTPTFEILARQLAYLFDAEPTKSFRQDCIAFLRNALATTEILIEQNIHIYERSK